MSNDQINVEHYEFEEPIKGYPELRWQGKRPFRSTQYFPAQLKEVYGQEDDSGWINKIFWGDNLQVMSHLLKEFRGKVDLIYIDPPFDSKADYKKTVKVKSKSVKNDSGSFEEKQYTDIWSNDEFLQFMYERLTLMKELLSPNGSIFLHCDYRKSSHLRLMMDEIFGVDSFRANICWRSMTASGFKGKTSLGKSHADILYFSKSENYKYFPIYKPYSDEYIKERFSKVDENGRKFKDEKVGSATPQETIDRWRTEGRIYITSTGGFRVKHYLDEAKGMIVDDIWTDIYGENSQSKDLTGYPTQKPSALLERIISMTTEKGDIVFDCFMGSGTTQAVANKLNRRFIGADINLGAIQTTTKRLASTNANFEVYNVNNYEVFRNPVEAKELLIEALEIQKLDATSVYDGEKDGYKVKIMPVNRIATKEDLNELIANFPYKQFESRKEANPNQPVEEIMLVCMGHEPSLGATLENESGYKLKVKVVDILRDKSDLMFKYDSEAAIKIEDNKLIIEAFYPRNLLQKLSQQKDDVEEWREMVESIMIDWNFDGAVMEPVVIDIPSKDEFVVGEYDIPEGASNIKVKITDLLSESYEEVIVHG
ncbi:MULTISPECIES: site-specific DNA-methyltransferase [unclassified Psychrobacter]|uniref:site-specific DNA-methyltransferase n=1 Tax=unclassified Psychrobacter TaxID=196806 RepID=UPI003F487846